MPREAAVRGSAVRRQVSPDGHQHRCKTGARFGGGCAWEWCVRTLIQKEPARCRAASGIIPEAAIGNSLQPERFRAKHALGHGGCRFA